MIKSETNRVEADESWKYYSLKPEQYGRNNF